MTQQDWDNLYQDWSQSYAKEPPTKSPKVDSYKQEYIRKIGRGTAKARFFLTSEGIDGEYGFWCPKSAIISDDGNELEIASWCKLKTIEYVRY